MAGWNWEMEGKKGLLGSVIKERLCERKSFWFAKASDFQVRLKSFLQKKTFWFAEKVNFFSSCKVYR